MLILKTSNVISFSNTEFNWTIKYEYIHWIYNKSIQQCSTTLGLYFIVINSDNAFILEYHLNKYLHKFYWNTFSFFLMLRCRWSLHVMDSKLLLCTYFSIHNMFYDHFFLCVGVLNPYVINFFYFCLCLQCPIKFFKLKYFLPLCFPLKVLYFQTLCLLCLWYFLRKFSQKVWEKRPSLEWHFPGTPCRRIISFWLYNKEPLSKTNWP